MQVSASTIIPYTPANLVPDEIIFYILQFLDPHDIIRLRLVSKQFNDVTRDARVWRTLYATSRLLRPPGPFLWQSTQFLERILIHSARVSRTWTSQVMKVVSRVRGPQIPIQPSPVSTPFDFLFGRLFIWCERDQLLAQDFETGVGRLLWQGPQPISSLSACSLTLPDGERVFVAVRYIDEPISQRTPIKLLEFPLQDDVRLMLGPVAFEMDLPKYANFPLSAKAPFLYLDGGPDRLFWRPCERVVIHARTRAMYIFPAFSSTLDAAEHWEPIPRWHEFTLLLGGHIVVFYPWWHADPPTTLIQAFVVPDSSTLLPDKVGRLRLTHEALAGYPHGPVCCLRGAIIDPETGDVNMRFLSSYVNRGQTRFLCVDITLPPGKSTSSEILPMVVHAQEVLILSGLRQAISVDTSEDGYVRGIVTLSPPEPAEPLTPLGPVNLYKFSVDASGEHCTAVVSEPCVLTPQDALRYAEYNIFNGVRGRICHDQVADANPNYLDLLVLDLH